MVKYIVPKLSANALDAVNAIVIFYGVKFCIDIHYIIIRMIAALANKSTQILNLPALI
jgi:hypothetical protein